MLETIGSQVDTEQDESQQTEPVTARWDRVECTCPEWCERDHELD
jgi:hypothetical protein